MDQAEFARAPGVVKPGCDGAEQGRGVLTARQQVAGQPAFTVGLKHQQHALGAEQFGDLVDQELVQLVAAAQFVQAQTGVDQALEGLAQIARHGQVGEPLFARNAAPRRLAQPGAHDGPVDLDLVQKAAAQSFVAHVAHGVEEERVRALQRSPGGVGATVGGECARVPPPQLLAAAEHRAGEPLLTV